MIIKLIADSGPARGQALEFQGKLFIGRDAHCQVRPHTPKLAGIHALIETVGDQVYVRDCGDTEEGTIVNDRRIHSKEVAVFDGDQISVDGVSFTLRINPKDFSALPAFSQVPEGWPNVVAVAEPEEAPARPEKKLIPVPLSEAPGGSLCYEAPVPGATLIVRLKPIDFNDERTVAPLRSDLQLLSDLDLPHQVVIDLAKASYMSSGAVGVILAYYQRLNRVGGELRVCHANDKVRPVLKQMRLDRVIDLFDTLGEALEAPWE